MPDTTIDKDCLVAIHYALSDEEGKEIDSSSGGDPLAYLHGHQQILPKLEASLGGRAVGDTLDIALGPKDGYGEHNPDLVFQVPRTQFDFDVEVGGVVRGEQQGDHSHHFLITEVTDTAVTLDGNHPLAGRTLNFQVTVDSVREATPEEIAQCGAHEQGGCSCGEAH